MTDPETPTEAPSGPPQTLILGLGNVLLTDEAVGPVVVQRLADGHRDEPALRFLDGGTLSFTLAVPIEECTRLIVVDAAALGEPPGSVRVFEGEVMDRQLSRHAKSVHEVSLADLMDIARLTGRLPERRALIGIEPEVVDWGDGLTPRVAAAVPKAMAEVRRLLSEWDEGPLRVALDDDPQQSPQGPNGYFKAR